ncbi:hypothetical protein [Bradyrhizobium sp. SZCCHNS1054]|uniref:hypothetical protein n=1 Tax=Bradyrhizobium sp. SZCCHNS1054 TaxID=3057301 RepID=UPI002916FB81|nr:hypothetical protein [Bradyrhizobium sp. SZCCHNS1054]
MLAITCAAGTIIWGFVVSLVADRFGPDVGARFLERGTVIPSMNNAALSAQSLSLWLRDSATARWLRAYRIFVIPLDFIYLLLLGGFLATGALSCADVIASPRALEPCLRALVIALPILYIVADAVEDLLIVVVLGKSNLVSEGLFSAMRVATKAKLIFVSLALVETLALGAWATFGADYG